MSFANIDAVDLPAVDESAMREVDRRMVEEVGIDLVRMMENAGRHLADVVMSLYRPRRAVVLYGSGGNGGGALVAARHLVNRGAEVVLVPSSADLTPVPRQQHRILEQMGVLDHQGSTPPGGDLVVDGMVGYSLRGEPTGRVAELISWCDGQDAPVVALDVPTGFSAEDGGVSGAHVRAAVTVTLALPKSGLVGHPAAGRLYLADISVPQTVYRDMGLQVPADLFATSQVVHLR